MKELVMYRCSICGNVICMVKNSGVVPECCGEEMELLRVRTEDTGAEKHVPQLTRDGRHIVVDIGQTPHPMAPEHHIRWIAVLTCCGIYSKKLKLDDAPEAAFTLRPEEQVLAVYAWCNVHGLWALFCKEDAAACPR